MSTYIKILSSTTEIGEAPEYIRVLPLGHVSSEKGNFTVDAESFRSIKNHIQYRNIDVVIDYEHQTLANVQAPASGWIKELSLKSDGIYARVEWTKRGKSYVLNKEYRYLSPVVEIRKEDGKVTKLHSVALTNAPAIHGMTPIINSIYSRQDEREEEELDLDTKHILKMLNVSEDDFKRYRREEKE